jgi:hypothetical protein
MPVNPNAQPPSPFRGSLGFSYPDNSRQPTPRHPSGWPQISRPGPPHVTRQTNLHPPQIIVQSAQPAQSSISERNRPIREHPSSPQSAASSNDTLMHLPNTYPVTPKSESSSPRGVLASNSPTMSPSSLVGLVGNRGSSQRRERAAVKNERGYYVCDHDQCVSEQITFARKCEWRLVFAFLPADVSTNGSS